MRNTRTDSGSYNRPAQIQAPLARVDDGQGGNTNANQWTTVRGANPPLMIHLLSGNFGRGLHRAYQYGQLYPTASHWAECRYANDVEIDASMTLVENNQRYQILGAIDVEMEHVTTILALIKYQARGSI